MTVKNARTPLPTPLSAAEIRERYAAAVRERSLFSARTTSARYLQKLSELLKLVEAGELNESDARLALQVVLNSLGYDPATGFPGDDVPAADEGGLTDLASDARLRLVLRTNQSIDANLRRKAAAAADPARLAAYPGWRFVRKGWVNPKRQRNWETRWANAWRQVGGEGAAGQEMVALKSSPIWDALGNGAGGYRDSTGSSVPPFAYNSQMSWLEADRATCVRLGLLKEDDDVTIDFAPSLGEEEISRALDGLGDDFAGELLKALAS